nr:RNA-directed DNA polymerase, eukaryota [Tanacetum cinerariifolium]
MYNVNSKNIISFGDLTCLFVKVTLDESKLWHRRLGHINFKTMNKLVKVLTRSKLVPLITVRPVTTAVPHNNVIRPRPAKIVGTRPHSPPRKNISHRPSPSASNFPLKVTTVKASKVNAVKGVRRNWVLKPKFPILDHVSRHTSASMTPKKFDYTDALGRSKEDAYLTDFKERNGEYVAFGGNPKGGKITDPLGKFDGKADEGFLVGYPVSKSGPTWMFDIDTLTKSMNYQPVTAGNQSNLSAGIHEQFDAEKAGEENVQQYMLFPLWSSGCKDPHNTNNDATFEVKEPEFEVEKPESEVHVSPSSKFEDFFDNSINEVNAASTSVPAVRQLSTNSTNTFSADGPSNTADSPTHEKSSYVDPSQYPDDPNMPALEDVTYSDDEEDNRVLVTKPHNKTPYELLHCRTPRKVDKEFQVGYSVNSKAFRVFNSRTRIVQETLNVNFLENKPNIAGSSPTWLFDINSLTRTMNYQPVTAGNQSNPSAGFQDEFDAEKAEEEVTQQYMLFPVWSSGSSNPQNKDEDAAFDGKEHEVDTKKPESVVNVSQSISAQSGKQDDKTKKKDKGKSSVDSFTGNRDLSAEFEDHFDNNSNDVNAADSIVPTAGQNSSNSTNPFSAIGPSNTTASPTYGKSSFKDASQLPNNPDMKYITCSDHENVGAEADFNNLETSVTLMPPSWDLRCTKWMSRVHLYGTIEEEVYVCQPLGFEDPGHPDKVCKVVKALYGLHHAPRTWKKDLKKELANLDATIDKGDATEDLIRKCVEIIKQIQDLDKLKSSEMIQKAKITWTIEGDENTKYFHGVLNKKRSQNAIRGVLLDGKWVDTPIRVKNEFLNHFKNRFEKPKNVRPFINMDFNRKLRLIQQLDLEAEVTTEEIKRTV